MYYWYILLTDVKTCAKIRLVECLSCSDCVLIVASLLAFHFAIFNSISPSL